MMSISRPPQWPDHRSDVYSLPPHHPPSNYKRSAQPRRSERTHLHHDPRCGARYRAITVLSGDGGSMRRAPVCQPRGTGWQELLAQHGLSLKYHWPVGSTRREWLLTR
jgi:hypothetical protein